MRSVRSQIAPHSGHVALRPTTESDLEFVLGAEAHEENSPFIGQWPRQRHVDALSSPDVAHLIVERADRARMVGYLIVIGLQDPNHSVNLRRIVITEKGKGYGREALRLVARLAFEQHGAHRLWLDVMEHNSRARWLYESEGFAYEGTLRECMKVGETFVSLVIMSMLRDEMRKA